MKWNEVKFQMMRFGKDTELKENTDFFTPEYEERIEEKNTIKDLGVLVDVDLRYSSQIMSAVSKARRKLGWVLRTFRTRSVQLLKRLWNSIVQPHLDYGSVVWVGQASKAQRLLLEGPLRSLTRSAWGLKGMNYWERLQAFKLYSNERRMERYAVMYIWKSMNGLVPTLDLKWSQTKSSRSGSNLMLPVLKGPEGKNRTLMRNSLKYRGVKLFNSIPNELKTFEGSLASFKVKLDKYLELLPDQPEVGGLKPEAVTIMGKPSNSIVDWGRKLDNELSVTYQSMH